MRSLASGLLQEVEVLTGSERQKKEKVVKMTLGSIFTGKASYSWMRHVHGTYVQDSFAAGSDTVGISCVPPSSI